MGMIYRTLAGVRSITQGQSYHSNSVTNYKELTGKNCQGKRRAKVYIDENVFELEVSFT